MSAAVVIPAEVRTGRAARLRVSSFFMAILLPCSAAGCGTAVFGFSRQRGTTPIGKD
jgi:hypothetical protein